MDFILVVDMNSEVVKNRFDRTAAQSLNKNLATITAHALFVTDIVIVDGSSSDDRMMEVCA